MFDGADLNIEALKRCSGGLERVLYYDILEKRQEFRDRYDVAILFDVIEHIEPTRPFLEAVLFHLKPGGIVLVNVPALMTLFSVYDKVAGHYRRYIGRCWPRVRDLDATVVDQVYWGFSMVPLLCCGSWCCGARRREQNHSHRVRSAVPVAQRCSKA